MLPGDSTQGAGTVARQKGVLYPGDNGADGGHDDQDVGYVGDVADDWWRCSNIASAVAPDEPGVEAGGVEEGGQVPGEQVAGPRSEGRVHRGEGRPLQGYGVGEKTSLLSTFCG